MATVLSTSERVMVAPIYGRTNRMRFWVVLFAGLVILGGILAAVSRGAVAMAATIPLPLDIRVTNLTGTNFMLVPGTAKGTGAPTGVGNLTGDLKGLSISKSLGIAGHDVILNITTGPGSVAHATGLTLDLDSLNSSGATFSGLSFATGGQNGLSLGANQIVLDNGVIHSPFLMANSITLPGLGLSFTLK